VACQWLLRVVLGACQTWSLTTPLPTVAHAFSFWATGRSGSEAAGFLGFGVSVAQVALVTHVSDEVENWAKCSNTLASVAHDLGAQVVAAFRAHSGQLVC
jgi:hypothetical protein